MREISIVNLPLSFYYSAHGFIYVPDACLDSLNYFVVDDLFLGKALKRVW